MIYWNKQVVKDELINLMKDDVGDKFNKQTKKLLWIHQCLLWWFVVGKCFCLAALKTVISVQKFCIKSWEFMNKTDFVLHLCRAILSMSQISLNAESALLSCFFFNFFFFNTSFKI